MKHGKSIFVHRGEYPHMRTIILDLVMQKCSRVVQMIIAHKSFQVIYIFKTYLKVALAVELTYIYFFSVGLLRNHNWSSLKYFSMKFSF